MSSTTTQIDEKLALYLKENFGYEDELLTKMRTEFTDLGLPDISISAEQGAFMQFIIKSNGIKNIVEIGSLFGYSAITMARAIEGEGKVTAVEHTARYCDMINVNAGRAGVSDKVEAVNMTGLDFLKSCDA